MHSSNPVIIIFLENISDHSQGNVGNVKQILLRNSQNRKLSVHDRIALAIAKKRNITLLTGDQALRNAARSEGVSLIGTIGILDQLHNQELISTEEYVASLKDLQAKNGTVVRLPARELSERIQQFTSE